MFLNQTIFYFKVKIPFLGWFNTIAKIHSPGQVYFGLLFCIHENVNIFPYGAIKHSFCLSHQELQQTVINPLEKMFIKVTRTY